MNSHWTTSHVNYLVDSAAENPNGFFLDSKDAKCVVCEHIALVLKPGRTWRTFETPDHSFDQSRINAVTPMTHLFMDIKNEPQKNDATLLIPNTDVVINVTRTGKAVTLINLSFSEPETVFGVFNELFLLMCIPSLDQFFRNPETGKLKEMMGFIVDNGPSEVPSNLLVQMLLIRLLKFLDLDKASQRSFAEYLSKRNFVERVHTVENKVLSDHGHFLPKWFMRWQLQVVRNTMKIWSAWLKMLWTASGKAYSTKNLHVSSVLGELEAKKMTSLGTRTN